MEDRTIVVKATDRPVTFYNGAGELQQLGRVVVEDYQAEVSRFQFYPDTGNRWAPKNKQGAHYNLGTGSAKLDFVSPSEAQNPLLATGWQIVDQYATKGGLRMHTIFSRPEITFEDPYSYDRDMWHALETDREYGSICPAVLLETNLTVGRMAAKYVGGLFRIICLNGLIIRALDLGEVSWSHIDYSRAGSLYRLKEAGFVDTVSLPKGDEIGTLVEIRKFAEIIGAYREARKETPSEIPPRFRFIEEQYSSLSVHRTKDWALKGYLSQLNQFADWREGLAGGDGKVYALDIAQCYTNAVNLHREQNSNGSDRGIFAALSQLQSIAEVTQSFVGLARLFLS